MIIPFRPHIEKDVPVCNVCGSVFDGTQGYLLLKTRMPYGSKHDYDMINACICADCADKFVESCLIDPIINESKTKNL